MNTDNPTKRRHTAFPVWMSVSVGVAWLLGTRALWGQSNPCDLSLYGSGGPSAFTNFLPLAIAPGGHPTNYAYTVWNLGGYPCYSGVLMDFYLSRDTTIGNGDDIWIGQREDITSTFNPGSAAVNVFGPSGVPSLTIPSYASGGYYVYMHVKPYSSAQNYDPYSINDAGFLSDPVTHGYIAIMVGNPPPTVSSITRNGPATNNWATVEWLVIFSTSVTSVDPGDFTLTRLAGNLQGYSVVNVVQDAGNAFRVWANTGVGDGVLRLDVLYPGALIYNTTGQQLTNSFTAGESYTIDKTPPGIIGILGVSPNPRATPVTDIDFVVSEAVFPLGSTVGLTRDGDTVSFPGLCWGQVSNTTYRICSLAPFTDTPGTYVLTINGNGLLDLALNTCTNSMSTTWVKWATPDGIIYVDKTLLAPTRTARCPRRSKRSRADTKPRRATTPSRFLAAITTR